MRKARLIGELVWQSSLGLWLGAMGVSAGAAAVIFPTVRDMGAKLPGLDGYQGEHWRLLAGKVAFGIFRIADVVQVVAGALACAAMLFILRDGLDWSRWCNRLRAGALMIAVGILGFRLAVLGPRMTARLDEYWTAAADGQNEAAERARGRFDTDHPLASRLIGTTGIALLAAMGLGLVSAAGYSRDDASVALRRAGSACR